MIDIATLTEAELTALFTPVDEVARQIAEARQNGRPYSLVRLGDGENAALAPLMGEEFRELAWVAQGDHRFCGLVPPDAEAAARLVYSIRNADMVGVLYQGENKWYRPMTQRTFGAAGIFPKQITYAYNNLALTERQDFLELLRSSRVAIVGRLADSLADLLTPYGVSVTGRLMLGWYQDVDRVLAELGQIEFDLCLASCGVNAVIISQQVAERYGKIGIDFGSAATCLVHGSVRLWQDAQHP